MQRHFIIKDSEIEALLLADNSDDDEDFVLDHEDIEFLNYDVENEIEETVIESTTLPVESSTIDAQSELSVTISRSKVSQKPTKKDRKSNRPSTRNNSSQSTTVHPTNTVTKSTKLPTSSNAIRKSTAKSVSSKVVLDVISWKKKPMTDKPFISDYSHGKILFDVDVASVTPFDIFKKVSNFDELIDHIVGESTRYMNQKGNAFVTDADEIKAFLGINLIMSYHKLPSIRDYWSTEPDLHVSVVANVMPRKRFEFIRLALHFNNNDNMLPRSDPQFDRGFKIRPIIDHYNESFQAVMNPTKQQTIDEHMIKFKGKNSMKQYIKSKPIKWGFKMWCRCESKTGFLFEFDLYTGKKMDQQVGLGEGIVLQLSQSLEDLGCEIYIDNFFNSPSLQLKLLKKKFFACGTVRPDRKNMPTKQFQSDKAMKRGDIDHRSTKEIAAVKWMDNRAVYMLSNFISPAETSPVSRRVSGSADKIEVNCPKMIKMYNTYMGGVDLMDQKKVAYQVDLRSKQKYYLRLFFDLFDLSVVNSHIIFNKIVPENKKVSSLNFRREIAMSLIGKYTNRQRQHGEAVKKVNFTTAAPKHHMTKMDNRKRCVECAKNKTDFRTNNYCEICNVYLCYTSQRNCFSSFHKF